MSRRREQRSWARKHVVPSACRVRLKDGPWHWGVIQDLSPAGAGLRLYPPKAAPLKKYDRATLALEGREYACNVAWAAADPGVGNEAGSLRLGIHFDRPNVEVFQRKELTDVAIPTRRLGFEAPEQGEPPMLLGTVGRLAGLFTLVDAATELLLVLSGDAPAGRFAVFEPRLPELEARPALRGEIELARDVAAVLEVAQVALAEHADRTQGLTPPGPRKRVTILDEDELTRFRELLAYRLSDWPLPAERFAEGSDAHEVLSRRLLPALRRLTDGDDALELTFAETTAAG